MKRGLNIIFIGLKQSRLLLPALAFLWLSSCTLFQKQERLPQSISEEQYIAVMQGYGFHPQRNLSLPHTPIPFQTVAEARTYVAEVAKVIQGQSDGKVLHELQLRYPAPPTLEQQTSLKLIPLYAKSGTFEGSNYQGYRYGLINPNNLEEAPRILEILVDKKSESALIPGDETLARNLYASLTTGAKMTSNFTGYAFLYTDKYQYKNGSSYLNGQVFAKKVKLIRRRTDSTSPKTATGTKPGPATANRCVRWIDYYSSDGTYITTTCLEYVDYGGDLPWGDGGDSPSGPGDGGGGGGGGGTFPVEEESGEGMAVIRQQYGQLPGQQAYVGIAYTGGNIFYFDSGLTDIEGTSQWIHQVG